jgi:arylsulfatase A-like enzyme
MKKLMISGLTSFILFFNAVATEMLPNLVILFADNLGYDDISTFHSALKSDGTKTPNIDRLATEGIKFLNWNSAAALCSASRSALLTGRYPVKTGVYPRVFRPDATFGLLPEETTLAELLKDVGYATKLVGKWHLGHRKPFLPTNQGFDSWYGIPYHMSGGSVDNHTCYDDHEETMLLPLYQDTTIIQQPVKLDDLASLYASSASRFVEENTASHTPFFLYMAFSHVHQLCAPIDMPEQINCQWAEKENATFSDAVMEMDWIAGEILKALDATGSTNNTFVLFTSDNGPWVAEQSCSGSRGPFTAKWFQENVDSMCTACPHEYVPKPTKDQPRRCVLPETNFELNGVHCGDDSGLGSVWEANLRMPALIRYPGIVQPGITTNALVSTLDVIPTFLSLIGKTSPDNIDGMDISDLLYGRESDDDQIRILYFWRDGFKEGPLPPPYGRFDVAAAKYGNIKLYFSTKSAHYNDDVEVFHDPPLLFDVMSDPAESVPLDPTQHRETINFIKDMVEKHKESIGPSVPLCLASDPKYLPCVDHATGCRTSPHIAEEK